MLSVARRVERYEMAGYEKAISDANDLGLLEIPKTLEITLREETATEANLGRLAKGGEESAGLDH